MNVSLGQFCIFLTCVSIGGVFGIVYTLFYIVKSLIKNNAVKILLDCFLFVLLTFFYVLISYLLNFPSFRIYMAFGVILGLILYQESFNFILAKFSKKIYNIIIKKIKSKKSKAKDKLIDGRI